MEGLFEVWVKELMHHEGGYSNRDPVEDPGGETKFGISKRSYPNLDIKNLTIEEAEQIAHDDFFVPVYSVVGDRDVALLFQLADFAFNSGLVTALNIHTHNPTILELIAARIGYLVSLRNFKYNAGGWMRRIAGHLAAAHAYNGHDGYYLEVDALVDNRPTLERIMTALGPKAIRRRTKVDIA